LKPITTNKLITKLLHFRNSVSTLKNNCKNKIIKNTASAKVPSRKYHSGWTVLRNTSINSNSNLKAQNAALNSSKGI
jgi:hypothetical protein